MAMLAVAVLLVACGEDDGLQREFPNASRTAGVPPPGEGVDEDEAAPIGASIHLDGLAYTPQITRQLNPHIKPDQALLDGRRAGDGRMWLGAFVRVCNEDDRVRVPSGRLALVGAFGQRTTPTELPPTNPFEYDPRPLPADRRPPESGSIADRAIEGALVLFNIRSSSSANVPWHSKSPPPPADASASSSTSGRGGDPRTSSR